jgi:hypothetical protein
MHISTEIFGDKNGITRNHQIDLTETEALSIKIVNDIFNEITDALMRDDDFVNFKNGTMVADDIMLVSSMLNSIVNYTRR